MGLKLGLRDKELICTCDINFEDQTYRVRSKPAYDFRVKDSEERDVATPGDVLAELNAWIETRPHQTLILGKPDGKPNKHLLRNLKQTARNAGLNCDRCKTCGDSVKYGRKQECEAGRCISFAERS